ncbi:glycosyltransferase family A protein [Nocardiopsis sp. B62]|uniref:glycosyltransferase family A protein n=1 Tax=Nocardiopsis sp. B62 TaxID=2824874 RepID=UPI001B36773D|nr:glycosyltransferase family A protein [Nocardiopsis sp. B62]MBQ1083586.1 glycosyltransferase family 2 protein [Nocardiopsis sp. B62]
MTLVQGGPAEAPSTPRPFIRRNDYSVLEPPPLGEWEPDLSVCVVVPTYAGQEKLDLTLASMAAQSYPSALTEVVVVDDGSDPALRLPPIRPEHTRIVPNDPGGWARGHALNTGAAATDADVLLFFDADMIAFREHLEAQMRWHHLADYVAVTGHLRCVEHTPGTLFPAAVLDAVRRGEPEALVAGPGEELVWLRRAYKRTDLLREVGHQGFHYFIGGTGSVRRAFFEESGGAASALVLGEDTHLGYRFAQNGAVFVPELEAGSWHLGLPQMEARREEGGRFRRPFVGSRLPLAEERRSLRGRQWEVPLVDAVVETEGAGFDEVAQTVDALLAGDVADVRVTLVGRWSRVTPGRHRVLDDPDLDVRLLHEHYRCEPRVRLAESEPVGDPDVPFVLRAVPGQPMAPHALNHMIGLADETHSGLVRATGPGDDLGGPRLERVAALARARRLRVAEEDLDDLVDRVAGVHWIDGDAVLSTQEEPSEAPPVKAVAEPPGDWRERLEQAQARAESERVRAERLESRFRWLTRSRTGRLLYRIIG